jgi:hypothetical protein
VVLIWENRTDGMRMSRSELKDLASEGSHTFKQTGAFTGILCRRYNTREVDPKAEVPDRGLDPITPGVGQGIAYSLRLRPWFPVSTRSALREQTTMRRRTRPGLPGRSKTETLASTPKLVLLANPNGAFLSGIPGNTIPLALFPQGDRSFRQIQREPRQDRSAAIGTATDDAGRKSWCIGPLFLSSIPERKVQGHKTQGGDDRHITRMSTTSYKQRRPT